jgi:hypothetical protein
MIEEEIHSLELFQGVFTELIQELGVQGVQVEELYELDPELLKELKYILLIPSL